MSARLQFLRPGPSFARLPLAERRRSASVLLDALQRIKAAALLDKPAPDAPVAALVSWCAIREDIEQGIAIWRHQLAKAQKAARSAVAMGQGWPAPAAAGGPGCRTTQGVKTPYTPTVVGSLSETEK